MHTSEINTQVSPIFDRVDRSAIMIVPKPIFHCWRRCVYNGEIQGNDPEPGIFLLPQFDSHETTKAFIISFYDLFFQHELKKWTKDITLWPLNRTFDMFCQWFEIRISYKVTDTMIQPLFKESEIIGICEPPLLPKPGLCLTCCKENDEEEEFICEMIRMDQGRGDDFICYEYEPLN